MHKGFLLVLKMRLNFISLLVSETHWPLPKHINSVISNQIMKQTKTKAPLNPKVLTKNQTEKMEILKRDERKKDLILVNLFFK